MAPISLRPSEAVVGGLIDDFNGKITAARTILYDYNGTQAEAVPALAISIEAEDGQSYDSYYSAGDAKFWVPTDDGKSFNKVGDKDHFTKTCKLMLFFGELVMAGFSEDKLSAGDVSVLIGLTAHFQRKADPKRAGLVKDPAKDKYGDASTLVVTKILAMPGEAVKAPAKPVPGAPAAAAGSTSTTAASGVDVDGDATNVLLELLPLNNGSLPKNKVSGAAFKHITKDHAAFANRNAITTRIFNDAFLKSGADSGLWAFDGTTITLG